MCDSLQGYGYQLNQNLPNNHEILDQIWQHFTFFYSILQLFAEFKKNAFHLGFYHLKHHYHTPF